MSCVIVVMQGKLLSFGFVSQLNYNRLTLALHSFLFTCPRCIVILQCYLKRITIYSLKSYSLLCYNPFVSDNQSAILDSLQSYKQKEQLSDEDTCSD